MDKHAYLIMANENFHQLALLLEALDHPLNDLYLHIDAKVKQYDLAPLKKAVKYGKLFILENRIPVYWGDYSQIACELLLLQRAADEDHYAYYHLLSGKDMPLKSQREIHSFFEQHRGKEFVRIGKHVTANYEFRYKYYFRWLKKVRNSRSKFVKLRMALSIAGQKIRGIDRAAANPTVEFKKGTNWFSITDELARYVLSHQEWISTTFQDGYCCDEVFLQTLIYNSQFRDRLYYTESDKICSNHVRLIDWTRGRPYVFRITDKQQLLDSTCMFVRKVDETVDRDLVEFLLERAKLHDTDSAK